MVAAGGGKLILSVVFYRSDAGNEPVREWLRRRSADDRKSIGTDISAAQFGWPLGMPLVRKLEPGLWEIRSSIPDGIARVIFTVEGGQMVILNGFAKRSARTPVGELRTARRRAANLRKE